MTYVMSFTVENDFLRIQLKADSSFETSKRFWTELYDLCGKHDRTKILVISDSEPVKTLPAFDHAALLIETGFTIQHRVAWVETNPVGMEIDKFIENVLVNRGIIRAKLFSEESDAKKWLLGT